MEHTQKYTCAPKYTKWDKKSRKSKKTASRATNDKFAITRERKIMAKTKNISQINNTKAKYYYRDVVEEEKEEEPTNNNTRLTLMWHHIYISWEIERANKLQEEYYRQSDNDQYYSTRDYIDYHQQFPPNDWILCRCPYTMDDFAKVM